MGRNKICKFFIRVIYLFLFMMYFWTMCNAEATSDGSISLSNATISRAPRQMKNNTRKTSTKTDSTAEELSSLFIIVLCTLFGILTLGTACALLSIKMGNTLMNQQMANTEAMNHCVKVINVEKPPVTDGNSEDVMQMPVVKLKYEPCPDGDNMVEFKMQPDKNWEFSRRNLRFEKIVGEGAFGTVFKGEADGIIKKKVTTTVAIKMLKAHHYDTDMINLVIEMEVMKMIGKHENILNLLGCCTQGGPLLVITEYVSRGNLRDFLKQHNPNFECQITNLLGQKTLINFAVQIAKGMEYLASRKYVHRDLAARNVLVSEDYILKIADFGLARDIHNNDYYKKATEGALPVKWMAPEALCLSVFTTKTDVWSFGVTLWEIQALGDTPYPSIPVDSNLFALLHNNYRMEKPPRCPEEVYSVMRNCWNYEPDDRPSFSDLVKTLERILMETKDENYKNVRRCSTYIGFPEIEIEIDTPPSSQETVV